VTKAKAIGAPPGAGAAGKRLWVSIVGAYELEEHELAQLIEVVRTVDVLAELDKAVQRDGVVVPSPQGERAHPALVEARQQRLVLARLLAALRLPAGDEKDCKATSRQRRTGVRGVYGIVT